MTGSKPILAAGLAAGFAVFSSLPAEAAARHIDCFVLAVGVGGLLGGPPHMFATVTNNTSATIAAGTTYSLSVQGRHMTYHSAAALAPGQNFHVDIGFTTVTGPCEATYPDSRIIIDTTKLNNGTLKMQPSP